MFKIGIFLTGVNDDLESKENEWSNNYLREFPEEG